MSYSQIWLLLLSSYVFAIIPGPAIIWVTSQSLSYGYEAGIKASIGLSLGCLVHSLTAALGISVLLQTTPSVFHFVKILGALYIVHLGVVRLIQNKKILSKNVKETSKTVDFAENKSLIKQSFFVNLLNPKAAIFVWAFVPQFVSPQTAHYSFSVFLGGVLFILAAFAGNMTYVLLCERVRGMLLLPSFKKHAFLVDLATSGCYLAIGICVLL